jgi:hypothetical protein
MNDLQIELLREAIASVCAVCGGDLGIRKVRDGEKVAMTRMAPHGFAVCDGCYGKPIRLPDGSVLS